MIKDDGFSCVLFFFFEIKSYAEHEARETNLFIQMILNIHNEKKTKYFSTKFKTYTISFDAMVNILFSNQIFFFISFEYYVSRKTKNAQKE